MKVEGGCYCGQVRYEVEGDPVFKGQCHCRGCHAIQDRARNVKRPNAKTPGISARGLTQVLGD